jgi:hypothetical protein
VFIYIQNDCFCSFSFDFFINDFAVLKSGNKIIIFFLMVGCCTVLYLNVCLEMSGHLITTWCREPKEDNLINYCLENLTTDIRKYSILNFM